VDEHGRVKMKRIIIIIEKNNTVQIYNLTKIEKGGKI